MEVIKPYHLKVRTNKPCLSVMGTTSRKRFTALAELYDLNFGSSSNDSGGVQNVAYLNYVPLHIPITRLKLRKTKWRNHHPRDRLRTSKHLIDFILILLASFPRVRTHETSKTNVYSPNQYHSTHPLDCYPSFRTTQCLTHSSCRCLVDHSCQPESLTGPSDPWT